MYNCHYMYLQHSVYYAIENQLLSLWFCFTSLLYKFYHTSTQIRVPCIKYFLEEILKIKSLNSQATQVLGHVTHASPKKEVTKYLYMYFANTLALSWLLLTLNVTFKVKKKTKIRNRYNQVSGYQWESDNFTIRHNKREPRDQPFPSR